MKKLLYVLLALALLFVVSCGKKEAAVTSTVAAVEKSAGPAEGAATNNGLPYNLTPVKYDSRDDKYLYGINATILPIADGDFTMDIWRGFNSTVMQGQDESAAMIAMEEATGVKINWVYPPVGQERDNFNLRVSSNDLPHVFSNPPSYPGGWAKAIDDEVLVDLTPSYDQGLMPNIKYLRDTRADINRDIVDDSGRIYKFPVMDIIPTDPWSGMWVREDWLKEQGLELPTTIADWDKILPVLKKNYDAVLGLNIDLWYGVRTNFAFAGSYESANEWMHRDGKAAYGPIEPGYKDFLAKLNQWYEAGLIDPDFATRDQSSYNALMANGGYSAMGMAYGDVGQAKLTGASIAPNYKLTPVLQPTSYDGQEIHLHQDNSTVRQNANYVAIRAQDENILEPVVQWLDFNFSQYGGDLCSYGPEGVSVEWESDGEYKWIHPSLENDKGLDFWTVYPLFKMHAWGSLRNSASYEMEQEVWDCIELWDSQDSSWIMPDNITHTSDESRDLANIMTDINTYRDEMTLKFIVGQEPIENFDNFVATIKKMNIDKAIEIKTAALGRYFAR